MELLFVTILGAGIGAGVRYAIPRRRIHGMLLVPSIAAIVTAITWAALTWFGWKFDGTWIWVASLALGGIVSLIVAIRLPRVRETADANLLSSLSKA
jgi:uncharacterized membrane protein YqgA involved in biofilm formation